MQIEICDTPAKRSMGLQFRDRIPEDLVLHFVGDSYRYGGHFFHMHNVPFPIAIAALDHKGVILALQQIEPETGLFYPPRETDSVVEMHPGFPGRQSIGVGSTFPLREAAAGKLA